MVGFAPIHKPKTNKTDRYFWSIGITWGEIVILDNKLELIVLGGSLELNKMMCYGENVLPKERTVLLAEGESGVSINLLRG